MAWHGDDCILIGNKLGKEKKLFTMRGIHIHSQSWVVSMSHFYWRQSNMKYREEYLRKFLSIIVSFASSLHIVFVFVCPFMPKIDIFV